MAGPRAGVAPPPATYACSHCGADLVFAGVRSAICPYCASGNVVERPATADRPRPAFAIAFALDADAARRALVGWLGSRTWFADARIRRARIDSLRGVYVPAYLYSAVAQTEYTASIGEQYAETETRETTDARGHRRTEIRTVTRTEYRSLAGRHLGYVTDVLVGASAGLAAADLAAVAPYELLALRRYSPAVVAGWIAEEFARDPGDCLRASRDEAIEDIGLRLRRFLPGDSHCDLAWRTAVRWESLAPLLVPVWVLAVRHRDDRPALRVVINGQTGAIAGKVPLAGWKIAIAVLVAIAVITAIAAVVRGALP